MIQAQAIAFARTAPAPLLPTCLGLIGLGMVWRKAAAYLAAPYWLGEAAVIGSLAVFAAVSTLYLSSTLSQPGALRADVRAKAGRSAVPAGSEALMLSGAALLPLAPGVAPFVWTAGIFLHVFLMTLVFRELRAMGPAEWAPTGFLVVPFVGLIVAPIGGGPLGEQALGAPGIAAALFWWSLLLYLALLPAAAWRLATQPTEPRLRPGAYVLLAPPSVAVIGYDKLDPEGGLTVGLFALSLVILAVLARHRRWLMGDGFAPTWGCFTFPSAAFAGACLTMAARNPDLLWRGVAAAATLGATAITTYVALRMLAAWRAGRIVTL